MSQRGRADQLPRPLGQVDLVMFALRQPPAVCYPPPDPTDTIMTNIVDDTIFVANLPDVSGLRFRRFRGRSDYAALTEVGNASRLADGNEWLMSLEDTEREFNHLVNSDPATDMLIAEVDGRLLGMVRGEWYAEAGGEHLYWFLPHVHPDWRGRGIRRALLRWIEGRMREVATAHPPEAAKFFSTWAGKLGNDWIVLLEDEGYHVARYFNRMVRPLTDPIIDFPMPEGLELRPVLPEHYRAIWDADMEAFRDHWGTADPPDEFFLEWQENETFFRPELWQIAWDVANNEVAGQVRTFINHRENEEFGRLRGYTEFISVRRPYRQRGLARALISESLRVQKARGMTESALNVDTENLTGATRLYEDCGFVVDYTTAAYRKPL